MTSVVQKTANQQHPLPDDTISLTQEYMEYDGIGKAFLSVQEVDRRRDEVWSDRLNDIGQIISRCDLQSSFFQVTSTYLVHPRQDSGPAKV